MSDPEPSTPSESSEADPDLSRSSRRGSMRSRLRDKAPELILEAASVVFAVLLALAVDQWREGRAERRHAERARAAVEHELRSNADEIERMITRNREAVASLRADLASPERGDEISFDYQLAELSTAAWESARLSGAGAGLGLDWLIGASRLYEIQGLYADGQRQLVDRLAGLGEAIGDGDADPVLRGVLGRAGSLLTLSQDLLDRYREFLGAAGDREGSS